MRLTIEKRLRVVSLYSDHKLHFTLKKYSKLRQLALQENINTSENTLKKVIQRWRYTGNVCHKISLCGAISHTKVTNSQLESLDRLVFRRRESSAKYLKNKLRIRPSFRTKVFKYFGMEKNKNQILSLYQRKK